MKMYPEELALAMKAHVLVIKFNLDLLGKHPRYQQDYLDNIDARLIRIMLLRKEFEND